MGLQLSIDPSGGTVYLDVTTSTGRRWQQGLQRQDGVYDYSLRASLALGGRLTHLSGIETVGATVLCCYWTCG